MNVFLTFDIEIWCNGWDQLDANFAGSFDRYVYGRSEHGEYALPQTLAILNKHGLKGVFFVEPLFAARFGMAHLEQIVQLIRRAGQEVQLHLHPEWVDEALEPLIENCAHKRQHLSYYTLQEQTELIAHGRRMLQSTGSGDICAFRSGSFAANADTFEALRRNGVLLDTSLNRCYDISAPDLVKQHANQTAFLAEGVTTVPVTIFKDGFGKDRPAQVGACSFGEMRDALRSAHKMGLENFVIVSHNFEMLKSASSLPDWIVVRRFERLCEFLSRHTTQFKVRGFSDDLRLAADTLPAKPVPRASWLSTGQRYVEQIRRRIQ